MADRSPKGHVFRLRGESVSRLETFVDAAFAFALTLLVISSGALGEVKDLLLALHKVPTFAACFLLLAIFWHGHVEWSRRYGIEDDSTTWWSLVFVFVVLVWIFPLRMIISAALAFVTGGWVTSEIAPDVQATVGDLENGFLVYGIGFAALSAILLQLHRHALRKLGPELDAYETLQTRRAIGSYAILLGVACASIALTFPLRWATNGLVASLPGWTYGVTGILQMRLHKRFDRLVEALPAPEIAA